MTTEKDNQVKWYETMTVKMFLLGTMAILFLIPLQLIKMVIRERENSSNAVKLEITEQWGRRQTITGPVLNIPVYRTLGYENEVKGKPDRKVWHILPDELNVIGSIDPEIRGRGIYETVIYTSHLAISGKFGIPDRIKKDYTISYEEAYLSMGISDNRGLVKQVAIKLDGDEISAEPGLFDHDIFNSGLTFPVNIDMSSKDLSFTMNLDIKGSDGLSFTPVGKNNSVELSSSWTAPSFSGKFIPSSREIDDNGFNARWGITHLNRNFPQEWVGQIHDISGESFGAELILEVDHYQKSERSAKYGLLFIAFTFLVLLFIEVSSHKKVHIFNYFLVSLALVLFFSLLNALSEHIGFNYAYIVASLSTITLISGFSGSLLRDRKKMFLIGIMLTVLYAFLFFLLSLNEFAYLAGNIGLFIGLGAIMWLTTKTDLFRRNGL
jgi:inner membrane protein